MSQPAFVTGTFWRSCPLDVLQAEAETHAMSLELAGWHGDSTPALIRALLARVVAAESVTGFGYELAPAGATPAVSIVNLALHPSKPMRIRPRSRLRRWLMRRNGWTIYGPDGSAERG
jgi:hypothetical protein